MQRHIQDTCTWIRLHTITHTPTPPTTPSIDDAQSVAETCGVAERLVGIFPRRVVPKYIAYICIYTYVCKYYAYTRCLYLCSGELYFVVPARKKEYRRFFYMPSFCFAEKRLLHNLALLLWRLMQKFYTK